MNLRDEEQLQRYFEHKMTPGEEQNFLIDVAARDEMRLAFRSNLELLKALRADKDAATVSAALVRGRTLAALGLGASLLPNALKEHEVAQSAAMSAPRGLRLWSVVRRPAAMLLTGLLAGAAIVYSVVPGGMTTQNRTASHPTVTAPSTIVIPAPVRDEVAPATTATDEVAPAATQSAQRHVRTAITTKTQKDALPVVTKTNKGTIVVQPTLHSGDDSSK